MRISTLTGTVGVLSLALAAAPAMAQSDDTAFDGPYVGVTFGYSVQPKEEDTAIVFDRDLDGTYGDTITTSGGANAFTPGFCNGAANTNAPAGGCKDDDDGIAFSARAGYDRQMGNFVIGGVVEFGKADINDSVSAFSTTPASYTMTREINWTANARLRGGYAMGKTLFYATGGAAYADVDHSFATTNTANSFTGTDKSGVWGYTVGGGIEHRIGQNISVGVEYLYTDLNDDDYVVRAGPGTAPPTNPFLLGNAMGTDFRRSDEAFRYHSLRATVAFRF